MFRYNGSEFRWTPKRWDTGKTFHGNPAVKLLDANTSFMISGSSKENAHRLWEPSIIEEVKMCSKQVAPYGSWKSPITSQLVASKTVALMQVLLKGDTIYWKEMRPAEGGRNVIVRRTPDGKSMDITPPPFNARTRVHEYGGGAFTVLDGVIYFSNFADQRIYRQDSGGRPHPITPEAELRYADGVIDRRRNRMICVREDHRDAEKQPVNTLVSIQLEEGNGGQILVSGNDFYASPRLSPDSSQLAWLTWNHPNMPWDGTELWTSKLKADGSLDRPQKVAGGTNKSILQPKWSPNGVLHFISDRTGWWNLYQWADGKIKALHRIDADFGRPPWVFGTSSYGFQSARQIICTYNDQGVWRLAILDSETGDMEVIDTRYTNIWRVQVSPSQAVFIAGSPTDPPAIIKLDLDRRQTEVLRRSSDIEVDADYLSIPEAIEFPTDKGLTAHAFFYAPQNPEYTAPKGEKPPLLVKSHGGPTAATTNTLSWATQYWTSRGIAVLDVNYGGSTGYGRAYRERLNGQWGIVDVNDCVNAARHLAKSGKVDGNRLAIRGGSAGGYTTLSALTFHTTFKAGASYYGVSDLEALTKDTHKFESHYLDRMIGPYPETRDRYRKRSPIHFVDQISCPMILFQGLEDKVVPPSQAELMFKTLRDKGLPVAYIPFPGEQHGFRRAKNIQRTLEAELYFYSEIFGFKLADQIEPVQIENL